MKPVTQNILLAALIVLASIGYYEAHKFRVEQEIRVLIASLADLNLTMSDARKLQASRNQDTDQRLSRVNERLAELENRTRTVTQIVERIEVQKLPEFKPGIYDGLGRWRAADPTVYLTNATPVLPTPQEPYVTNGVTQYPITRLGQSLTNILAHQKQVMPTPEERALIQRELDLWNARLIKR